MSAVAAWEPGKLYFTGDLAKPNRREGGVAAALADGDFETTPPGTVLSDSHWTVVADPSSFTGARCAHFNGGSKEAAEVVLPDRFPVTPGDVVGASCMIDMGRSSSNNAGGAVRAVFFDASGARLSATEGNILKKRGGWMMSSVQAVAPVGAAFVGVGANAFHNGSYNPVPFDCFKINYTPKVANSNLIYRAVQPASGMSAAVEPVWPMTLGQQVIDNEVVWEAIGTAYIKWRARPALRSGNTEPRWPMSEGSEVVDGTVAWLAITSRVQDPKCPHSKVVAIAASKVFAADKDIIRFCATANPLDWSTPEDAGYLPSGLQQANSNDMAVLKPFRSNLAAWNPHCFQMWQVDPDPAQMAHLDQMDGIGSSWPHAAQPVGNDLFFLSQQGVRSVGIAMGAENLATGDIGSPIDVLVQEAMANGGVNVKPIATYYPGGGQYWLALPQTHMIAWGDLPDMMVGDAADHAYRASGGLPSYSFSLLSGSLPNGLTLSSNGVISGVASQEGQFVWTVLAVDSRGQAVQVRDTCSVLRRVAYDDLFKYRVESGGPTNTNDYSSPTYDDSAWQSGPGGFGGDPAVTLVTQTTKTYIPSGIGHMVWLRKTVQAQGVALRIDVFHDDTPKFWWNGVQWPLTKVQYYQSYALIPADQVIGSNVAVLRVIDGYDANGNLAGSHNIYASMEVSRQ